MKVSQTVICDTSTRRKTPEGFLEVVVRATRTGVMRYHINDVAGVKDIHGTGYVYIARKPEDVFDKKSLGTLRLCSITDEHPKEKKVTADNYKRETTGHVIGDAYHDEHDVYVPVIIKDRKAVEGIESGKTQISGGSSADIFEESGVMDGLSYDYTFKNIIYNHLSTVKHGRAGNAEILDEQTGADMADETKEAEITRLTTVNDELKAENAQLKQRLDSIERDTVINDAKKLQPDFEPSAGQTARQIKIAIINDAEITDSSDDALIDYAFRNVKKQTATPAAKPAPVVEIQPASATVNDTAEERQQYNVWND